MDEVEYIVQTDYTVAGYDDLLTVKVESLCESKDRAHIGKELIYLERRSECICYGHLECIGVIQELDILWIPYCIQLVE